MKTVHAQQKHKTRRNFHTRIFVGRVIAMPVSMNGNVALALSVSYKHKIIRPLVFQVRFQVCESVISLVRVLTLFFFLGRAQWNIGLLCGQHVLPFSAH